MKQIINGRRYDTEAPHTKLVLDELGPNGLGRSDFGWWRAGLYKTGGGAWFLAGDGGPATMFSYSVGNASSGGSGIIVLSADDARAYLESEGDRGITALEAYAAEFGLIDADAAPDGRSESLRIRLSAAEKAELQRQAGEAGETVGAYVRTALNLS